MNDLLKQILFPFNKYGRATLIARHLADVQLYAKQGIDALYPNAQEKCVQLMSRMKQLGMPIVLNQSIRTAKQQDIYYNQGRTTEGKIVTFAKGLQSFHQYGLAFDLIFETYGFNPPSEDWWERMGIEGEKLGLEYGGHWVDFKDRPHFQWTDGGRIDIRNLEEFFRLSVG